MQKINDSKLFLYTAIFTMLASFIMMNLFGVGGIKSMVLSHVALGGLAFLVGGITLFSKKGSPLHKLTGRLFYISMVCSVAITLIVSVLPGHVSPTMFHIGVLSLYFLIGGKRSIDFKKPTHALMIDKILAITVVTVSVVIMSYSIVTDGYFHPLRTVFGTVGVGFGLFDLWLFRNPQNIKSKWLVLHLSKMLGGYTAAVTAFFVAQNILSGYFNWFTPTVIGLSYIFYWMFKLNVFKSTKHA